MSETRNLDGLRTQALTCIEAAYDKGYKNGLNDGNINDGNINEGTFGAKINDAYNNGLNDAWECAKKIITDDGLSCNELEKIFSYRVMNEIFGRFSASEAVTKVKEYEEQKKSENPFVDEIHIGDEIYCLDKNHKSIVVGFTNKNLSRCLVMSERGFLAMDTDTLHKTGRAYPIKEMFEKLNESEG